jgi:pimeloyl-ACP methyl ester carboxylesterase
MRTAARRFSFADATSTALLGTADRARLTALRLGGVRSRWIATPAGRLHVLDARGEGPLPPIVLLHGLSATGADYAPLIRRLLPWTQRILAPDLPGHGRSPAPPSRMDARSVLAAVGDAADALLDRPAIVFGNSLGGAAAIRYALGGSPNVAGLFLVSPAGGHGGHGELDEVMRLLRADDPTSAREFMRRVLPSEPWSLGLLAWGARVRLRRPAVRRLIERTAVTDLLTPQELCALPMPVTLVWGAREKLLPREHAAFFRQFLPPHTRFTSPRTFGHAPFIDQPDAVVSMVRRFAFEVATGAIPLRAGSTTYAQAL